MNRDTLDDPTALYDRATAGDPQACYQLGRHYAAQQSFPRARRWLREAADRRHAGALTELGLMVLFGIGVVADVADGVRLLEEAEQAGSAEAAYQLALMGWCATAVPFDVATMERRLHASASGGHLPALRAAALVYARMPGGAAASHACLERAAAAGDPTSCHLLARRLARSGDATARARAAGLAERARAGGITRGNAGNPATPYDVPQPHDGDLPPLTLSTSIDVVRTQLSSAPRIETVDGVFDAEECELIMALGEPYLERATVHDASVGRYVEHEHRRSSAMAFYQFQEDFALRWLQWRQLALLGDVPMVLAEYLTLLRYRVGEEYRPHRDYLNYDEKIFAPTGPGQRVNTVFCYLCDVPQGGETVFPLQKITIAPKLGRLVMFRNVTPAGEPDEATLHAGLPVREGEKWLATLWTHERPFRAY